MQTIEVEPKESDASGNDAYLALPNVVARVSIECCSVIFLIDRLKLRRGILDFNVANITIDLDMSAASATLAIRTEPFELCAGQHQHSDAKETWILLPLKPIVVIDGVGALLLLHEKGSNRQPNTTASPPSSKILTVSLQIGMDVFSLNISPSAIIAFKEAANSLTPFLEWMAVDATEEEKRIMMEKQKESERRLALDVSRNALLEVFKMIDVDDSGNYCLCLITKQPSQPLNVAFVPTAIGGLQETELAEVIRQMFENTGGTGSSPSYRLTGKFSRSISRVFAEHPPHILNLYSSRGSGANRLSHEYSRSIKNK
jgi:hypothetical protein